MRAVTGSSAEQRRVPTREEGGAKRGEKKPDAIVGRVAVEQGGGSYNIERLKELWQWCAEKGMGIELF